jgi:hypothetical protein
MTAPTTTSQPTGTSGGILATVSATGNTHPIVYSLDQASLNAGLTINAGTGAVTVGTAQPLTNWPVVVTATDSGAFAPGVTVWGTKTITFNVTVDAIAALSVTAPTSSTLIDYQAGGSIAIVATGGTAPYTYTITGPASGCSFTGANLTVPAGATGTSFTITVTVTDSNSVVKNLTFTVTYN